MDPGWIIHILLGDHWLGTSASCQVVGLIWTLKVRLEARWQDLLLPPH